MCPQKAEHCLSGLQRWAQAVAISSDHRDRHTLLTLPLLPPRILCEVQVTMHIPLGACAACHCKDLVIQGQLPQENTQRASGCCNMTWASAAADTPRIPIMTTVPLPLPGLREQESPKQLLL